MASEIGANERKIREERAEIFKGMAAIMAEFDEKGTLSVEQRKEYDDREKDLEKLDGDLDRLMKFSEIDRGKDEAAETRNVSRDAHDGEVDVYERAFSHWLRFGEEGLPADDLRNLKATRHIPGMMEVRDEIRTQLDSSSLQTIPGQGGFMIPQGFWANLQIAMKAYGGLLSHCNVIKTATGNEMPWPTNNPTGVVGQYITEANQLGFTDFTFGQGILNAWTITSGVILASLQLMADSHFDVNSYVTDRIGEAIGRKVAAELWSGAGSASKALTGITTAIAANGGSGSGTALYPLVYNATPQLPGFVSGDTGASAGTGDSAFTLASPSSAVKVSPFGLVSWGALTRMIAGIDPAYRVAGKCNFFMNDAQVQLERQLTDGFGHPLWEPNTQAGQPDTILGYPVQVDNNSPSVSTGLSTAGGVLFGDMKTAMVVRQVDMAGTMRLDERYADFLQVGFLGYVRMDSQPNDLRAVVSYASPHSATV